MPAENAPCIAIVDDDDMFRESISLNLEDSGFRIVEFSDGPSFLKYLLEEKGTADAILLDWRMPRMDGLAVLKALREAGVRTPVLFLTSLSDEIYEEAGLRYGAVDFIEKSRSFSIIMQRLRLRLEMLAEERRAGPASGGPAQPDQVRRGDLELLTDTSRATWKSKLVDLTLTEFNIVSALAAVTDRDVTYRQIYDLARGTDFVAGYGDEGYKVNVRSFIKRIRQKFRAVDPEFDSIVNYPGYGYRWKDSA
ncbi:MAG: response regulator transcription factor [Dongiaceae bacterium]